MRLQGNPMQSFHSCGNEFQPEEVVDRHSGKKATAFSNQGRWHGSIGNWPTAPWEVCESRHVFPNHTHEGIYAIGLMEQGQSYCIKHGDDSSLVLPDQIALLNPGQVHRGIPAGNTNISYRMVYIDERRIQDLAVDTYQKPDVIPEFDRTTRRIEHAKQLLKLGLPTVQVALETGFSDQSHFANTFRTFTGATPRQYQADAAC